MKRSPTVWGVKIIIIYVTFFSILINSSSGYGQSTIIFEQNWEGGIGAWFASNGVWEVGTPTVGPPGAFSGQNCAGTILGGNYPSGANTRLESPISPSIQLPSLAPGESILLKFRHWYRNADDNGRVEISVNGGAFTQVSDPLFGGINNVWAQYVVDLSAYANSAIRIGYRFTSGSVHTDYGWYIDDIVIEKKVIYLKNPEDFEWGVGEWNADNGLWEVGIPTVGPQTAHSGLNVAGVVLNGNYPSGEDSRLISPEILLTPLPGQSPTLFFWHWFRLADDRGRVQISVNGKPWQTVGGFFSGTSPAWTQAPPVDLSSFADSTIQIAFLFSSGGFNVDNGWYIDDVSISGIATGIGKDGTGLPRNHALLQNFPNPFNPSTTIRYFLPETEQIELSIYNISGQKIITLVNGRHPVGTYQVQWDGRDAKGKQASSGVYMYFLKTTSAVLSRKMLLLR